MRRHYQMILKNRPRKHDAGHLRASADRLQFGRSTASSKAVPAVLTKSKDMTTFRHRAFADGLTVEAFRLLIERLKERSNYKKVTFCRKVFESIRDDAAPRNIRLINAIFDLDI